MAVGTGVDFGVNAVVRVGNAVVEVEDGVLGSELVTSVVAGTGVVVGRTVPGVSVSGISVTVAIGGVIVGVGVGCPGASVGVGGIGVG
jgi:hypothetical protein